MCQGCNMHNLFGIVSTVQFAWMWLTCKSCWFSLALGMDFGSKTSSEHFRGFVYLTVLIELY